ncbi:threonine synthase [Salpingoeca rosetta]|uniref:Homoserine kinase n=1 Tax=Salpingoeca rosetta (strain ATCC 50818 / BSB-021) TaxID=946362 RepID=F2UH39_SALR5|nr:threonine synthase [Salpingoeca rosetta]EGD76438.1 threonine synthase [Salpingoeca rosetta]|eukprot:XP_004991353.1 threonine synthase [Salpingoeca rosetta]
MSHTVRSGVTVRVPATTANMGPGYDSLGMALDLWNELTVEYASMFSIHIQGEGADVLPRNEDNFVVKGVQLAFERAGKPMPTLAFFCKNEIPFGSGLGSSSAGIISGILAGLVLSGQQVKVKDGEELLQMAASIEGHVDNIAPCIYGNLQIGFHTGERWQTQEIAVPSSLQCVVLTPNTPMNTKEARAMLKSEVPRDDAIFNIARTALLVRAFQTGDLDSLRHATEDKLHQPVRGSDKVLPALFPVIKAALDAGAKGAFLSGAGSSILAITTGARGEVAVQDASERFDAAVAAAMTAAAEACGVQGRITITRPTPLGAHVVAIRETIAPSLSFKSTGPRYVSTRRSDENASVSFEEAVMHGLAHDGGLYVPREVPTVSIDMLKEWSTLSFPDLAAAVMRLYIGVDEISDAALSELVHRSYSRFTSSHVTPLVKLTPGTTAEHAPPTYVLEQFHGPTCAFKDVALQFVGNLFEFFLARKNQHLPEEDRHAITVLGATSGDTGSAAIEGLRGKENVEVFILHPHKRVAPIQEAQMTTILDANVHNVAVDGAFDDCQSMVKTLFQDEEFREKHHLAAVNSINWARILAQIVYYFYMYFRWVEQEHTAIGTTLNVVVPTGNFGNILAGFYAKRMGLPLGKLVVATNRNDILYRFLRHRDYTARPVEPSLAPAMDIVVPSNFERFLYFLMDNNPHKTKALMKRIKSSGTLDLGKNKDELYKIVDSFFDAGRASDEDIKAAIWRYRKLYNYLPCPHTATALHTMQLVRGDGEDLAGVPASHFVCLATAHPGKFRETDAPTDVPPPLPPQLKGLHLKPKRCAHIGNDLTELKDFMDTTLAEREQAKDVAGTSSCMWCAQMCCGRWDLVAAAGVGAAVAIASLHLLNRRT